MDYSQLNYIDYFIAALIFLSTLFAVSRGFICSFMSLTGWILSVYLTYVSFPILSPLIEDKIKNPLVLAVVGHAVLLIGLLIIFGVINLLIATSIKAFSSGILDRLLGACFGVVRGATIASFMFLLIAYSTAMINGAENFKKIDDKELPKWLTTSQTYPYLKEGSIILTSFIPDSLYESCHKIYADNSKKTLDDRFIEYNIQKIRNSLDPQTVKTIDQKLEKDALVKSAEELKFSKLSEYLNAHQKNITTKNSFKKTLISSDDLNKLNSIVKKRHLNDNSFNTLDNNLVDAVEEVLIE